MAGARLYREIAARYQMQNVAAVYRSLRHKEMNRLQVALGWAQLGEVREVREALEAHVQEQILLHSILQGATLRQQAQIIRLLAHLERSGQAVSLQGAPRTATRAEASRVIAGLRCARSQQEPQTWIGIEPQEITVRFNQLEE